MEFSDTNEWHRVTDRRAYIDAGLPMIEIRVFSASSGRMMQDKHWRAHAELFTGFPRLFYLFPWDKQSPEYQADLLADAVDDVWGPLDMVMVDTEDHSYIRDVPGFVRRWCARIEPRLDTRSWVYVPRGLADTASKRTALYAAIGDRVVKCPRYTHSVTRGARPDWGRWDVWQYSDRAPMPGSPDGPGDRNWTPLTVGQLLARCRRSHPSTGRRRRGGLLLNG